MRPTPFSFASASSPFSSVHRAPLSISPFQSSRAAVRANHPRDFTFRRPRRWFTFDRRASIATPPNYPLGESLNNRGNVSSTNMARHEACKIAERERERERGRYWFSTKPASLVVEDRLASWIGDVRQPAIHSSRASSRNSATLWRSSSLLQIPRSCCTIASFLVSLRFFFFSFLFFPILSPWSFLVDKELNFYGERLSTDPMALLFSFFAVSPIFFTLFSNGISI